MGSRPWRRFSPSQASSATARTLSQVRAKVKRLFECVAAFVTRSTNAVSGAFASVATATIINPGALIAAAASWPKLATAWPIRQTHRPPGNPRCNESQKHAFDDR